MVSTANLHPYTKAFHDVSEVVGAAEHLEHFHAYHRPEVRRCRLT